MDRSGLIHSIHDDEALRGGLRAALEPLLRAAMLALEADGALLAVIGNGREAIPVSCNLAAPEPPPAFAAAPYSGIDGATFFETDPAAPLLTSEGETCRRCAAVSFEIAVTPEDSPDAAADERTLRGILLLCGTSSDSAFDKKRDARVLEAFGAASASQFRLFLSAYSKENARNQEAASRIETALESTTDSVVIVDQDWKITYVNRRALRIFPAGVDPIGRPLSQMFPGGSGSSFDQAYQHAFRKQEPSVIVDFYEPLDAWFEVHAFPSPTALTMFFRDITREKNLEEQLQQAQRIEAVGQLAGGIAHDFNNLLTVINGYTQLLLSRAGPGDPNRRELENIRDAGNRAAQLTQQLLAFGRKQVLQPKHVTLNEIVARVEPLLARVLPANIEVAKLLAASPNQVKADPAQIEQVLMNLVINARDAMSEGGRLTIETANVELDDSDAAMLLDAAPGRYAMLAVSDTGTGMKPETRSRIFEPFFTTKPKGQGTGLGLPTVFGIVKQSGGHIAVESELGRGSTFNIYLPITEEAAPVQAAPQSARAPAKEPANRTVLLVEDDEYVRNFTSAVLKQFGYAVLQASNGPEALKISAEYAQPIDLLLTDVIMPKMGGRELAARITRQRPETRVLFVSGYTEDALSPEGSLDPGLEFLPKPYTPRDLAERVRTVIEKPNRERRILIVDDDAAICDLLRTILESAGYIASTAHDGREAIRFVHQHRFDLVLMDLVMPGQEGIVTIQMIKQEFPHIGIIAMSGAVSPAILAAAKHLGANEVLQKPIASSRLLQLIAEITA
ncbi:MAG: response regulator [Acidobacteria bacterium]|nr:response regulator [Acidobacteriota bacterium]MCW5971209.1 response regulator [Blastocatellales bacterium]